MKQKFGQKQIPTLLGLAILVLSLIGGIWFIGKGNGVFAPRAAPQTSPQKVKITNVKDTSFTISFLTDEATVGFVKYGTDQNSLKFQSSDDRDQLTGAVSPYATHYITVRDLKPDTQYFYTLGTGSTPKFDNGGTPFTIKTAKKLSNPPNAKTIYGTVTAASGTPVGGAMVYVTIAGAGELSSLTKESTGSWAVPLSSARTSDGLQYATLNPTDSIQLTVAGPQQGSTATGTVTIETAQPAPALILGAGSEGVNNTSTVAQTKTTATQAEAIPATPDQPVTQTTTPAAPPPVEAAIQVPIDTTTQNSASPSTLPATTLRVDSEESKQVDTTQPVIIGKAAPKVLVNIQIHSDSEISTQITTDSAGNYSVDLAQLEQQLEPGEHTITITYVDPKTKKTITETKTFTVTGTLAAASPKPFGTNNPFTIATPSPTPSPTASASAAPRVSVPASSSAKPVSGTTETTFALLLGGTFFLVAAAWSSLHNVQLAKKYIDKN
jgi:hypothetical protein